ncbi:MAG: transcription antitermination factor NusB [Bacilli bacterium]
MKELSRRLLRTKIMTILYQVFLYQKLKLDYNLTDIIQAEVKDQNAFVNQIIHGVLDNQKTIDQKANEYLKDWMIERLGSTDQVILRMGIYELLYTDTPPLVCINEAVELAKLYSDERVVKMINGVLDKIYHNMR